MHLVSFHCSLVSISCVLSVLVSCLRFHVRDVTFVPRRFNRNLLCNSRNVNFECVSFLSPGLLCDIKILDMLLFPDPGAKRIYEIFAVTYWNVQIFSKTHTRHDAHKHCPFPYLAVMLCTVLGCLCSLRLNLNHRYPSWMPRLSFLQETQLGRYEPCGRRCLFLRSCSINQIILSCRWTYQFHAPIFDPGLTVGEHLLQLQPKQN